jgi:hypothetical protein
MAQRMDLSFARSSIGGLTNAAYAPQEKAVKSAKLTKRIRRMMDAVEKGRE